jgi:hypothetical protein
MSAMPVASSAWGRSGASAPLKELQKKFGFEPDRVVATVKVMLGKK